MFLDNENFKCVVKNTPLVSIDFIIRQGQKYLLGKRINSPAKNFYFTIGGRIFKNETIKKAQKRILKEEMNLTSDISYLRLNFIGIFEHFYKDSFFGDDISTHYINLAYLIDLNNTFLEKFKHMPFKQHSEYIWLSQEEILNRDDVHRYVKESFKTGKKKGII